MTMEIILASVVKNEAGCWQWTRVLDRHGYAVLWRRRRMHFVHRLVYAAMVGPIGESMTVDHLCRNRRCINPSHMEAVSRRENTLRGTGPTAENARKTHCKRGHPLEGQNLYEHAGHRACRACIQIRRALRVARA